MLFADLSIADFKANYYRKRPLLVRGGARSILGKLYTHGDFDAWRKRMEQHHSPYVLDSGAVVAVLRASSVVPELKRVADRFTREFPGVIAAFDTFRTGGEPGGSVGAHFDDNDNFILQQTGSKRWKVARPEYVHPESAHARAIRGERLGQVIMADEQLEFELEAGDALYIPSFWIHWGIGLGESLSLSLALNPVDTALLLREAEIYPAVQSYVERPPRAGPAALEPSPGLSALTGWARRSVPADTGAPRLFGLELSWLLESHCRAALASLLDALPSLEQRPIAKAHGEHFVRCLAGVGMLEQERAENFLASNVFTFISERALDAIVFADTYKLREIGDVLAELGARLHEPFERGLDALLCAAGDAPALQELRGAGSLLPTWREVAKSDPVLFELGSRFAPVAARAPVEPDERTAQSLSLRIGTPSGRGARALDGAEEHAVYALGHRAGRALARVLPAFHGFIAYHVLAALEWTELRLLSDFCHVYGLLACRRLAERSDRPLRAAALTEAARESAERVLADPRVTEVAQATLRRTLIAPLTSPGAERAPVLRGAGR